MEKLRIKWCPPRLMSDEQLISTVMTYTGPGRTFRLYKNGTVLLVKPEFDTDSDASRCLEHLQFIPDFKALPLKDGNFMVSPHEIAFVVVTRQELDEQIASLNANREGAMFPGEAFLNADANLPIGLIGRAKINNDAFEQELLLHHIAVRSA